MSKTMKTILIIGIVLILAGGLAYGAAYAIGERFTDSRTGEFSQTFNQGEAENISNFRIGSMVAKVNISNSSGNEITINAQDIVVDNFRCGLVNGTLEIDYDPIRNNWNFISLPGIGINSTKTPVINIAVPESIIFDNFEINGGVGEINMDYIHTGNFIIHSGVGAIKLRDSTINKLEIKGSVGEYTINGDIGEMSIGSGVGSVRVSGSIERDIRIEGGVGEVYVNMTGDITNYNVSAKTGIGVVRINGERAGDLRNNADAPYRLTVEGGIGNIDININ